MFFYTDGLWSLPTPHAVTEHQGHDIMLIVALPIYPFWIRMVSVIDDVYDGIFFIAGEKYVPPVKLWVPCSGQLQ